VFVPEVLFIFFGILFVRLGEGDRESMGGGRGRGRSRCPVEQGARCGAPSQDLEIMT